MAELSAARFYTSNLTGAFPLSSHLSIEHLHDISIYVVPKSPIITNFNSLLQGLIAHYNADSWMGSRWTDLSGAGNHVTDIGGTTSISVMRPVGAPAYVYGAPTAWMGFPEAILPSAQYTLFYVARYNGAVRGRIFQGVRTNWLSGFIANLAGVAHHDSCSWMTGVNDMHCSDWVLGTDRSNSFRSNGEDRTINSAACTAFDRLAINTGTQDGETSDFAVQSVLVYNRKLADADVLKVEAWLSSLQPTFTPGTLQVRSCSLY